MSAPKVEMEKRAKKVNQEMRAREDITANLDFLVNRVSLESEEKKAYLDQLDLVAKKEDRDSPAHLVLKATEALTEFLDCLGPSVKKEIKVFLAVTEARANVDHQDPLVAASSQTGLPGLKVYPDVLVNQDCPETMDTQGNLAHPDLKD